VFNNIFWDNRAGGFDGTGVTGIGSAGDLTPVNRWDIGSMDGSGDVEVYNSVLQTLTGTVSSPTNRTPANVNFRKPQVIDVHVDARRSVVVFRQTVIVGMLASPFDTADWRLRSNSAARNIAALNRTDSVTLESYAAPLDDLAGVIRTSTVAVPYFDAGAREFTPYPPTAPTNVRATRGNGLLTVRWNEVPEDGGSPVTYTARAWSAATGGVILRTCTTNDTSCILTGLTNGRTYYVDVTASNSVGVSTPSTPRVAATPATAPSQITSVSVTRGRTSLTVAWGAPSNGGSPITSYRAFVSGTRFCVVSAPTRTCTITGLNAGNVLYNVRVTATNQFGTSPASAPVAARTWSVPGRPINVSVIGTSPTSVHITWSAPANAGNGPITQYRVFRYTGPAGGAGTLVCTVTAPAHACDHVPGTSAARYYTVLATNVVGTGLASTPRVAGQPL
jgi:hypothetical protein